MVKHFCDLCTQEIDRNVVSERVKFDDVVRGHSTVRKRVQVEVMVGVGDALNNGDLCINCLFKILDREDQRPKALPVMGVEEAMRHAGWSKNEIGAAMDARGAVAV